MKALLVLALAGVALAGDNGLPRRFFDTRADRAFGDATVPIEVYVRAQHVAGTQHVCIVGYEGADGDRFAEVHWREGHQLVHWRGSTEPRGRRDSIRHGHPQLDLERDVVANEAAIAGSTYLVTRAWVDQVLDDCTRHGTRYTVRR